MDVVSMKRDKLKSATCGETTHYMRRRRQVRMTGSSQGSVDSSKCFRLTAQHPWRLNQMTFTILRVFLQGLF